MGFNLAAQAGHLNVDRAVIDLVVVHPARLEELVAREDPPRGAEQRGEQVELAVRQVDGSPAGLLETPRSQVELELGEPVGTHLSLARMRQRRAFCASQ